MSKAKNLIVDLLEIQESKSINVKWVLPPHFDNYVKKGEMVVVWVDVAKIDAAFKKDREFYVGKDGEGGIGRGSPRRDRYANFGEWIKNGEAVQMSEIVLDPDGTGVRFDNGRHRFAWLRDHGAKAVPMITPSENANTIKKLFGSNSEKTSYTA